MFIQTGEEFVDPDTKEDVINDETDNLINLADVFEKIYDACGGDAVITMTKEAYVLYKEYQREVIAFRKQDLFEEARVSVKSKSVGIMVRLSGILSLLREGVSRDSFQSFKLEITKEDVVRAINIVRYSNEISFHLLNEKNEKIKSGVKAAKSPVPHPDEMSVEFLVPYHKKVKILMDNEFTPIADINKNNVYPIINNERSNDVGMRFVKGLVALGFGEIKNVNGRNGFKRYNPDDENCPEREALKQKYKKLNLNGIQTHS